jgi:hypothetical protein
MNPAMNDPTAGRRAWDIAVRPYARRVILDPTDPRNGEPTPDRGAAVIRARRILDPTDPRITPR